MSNKKLLKYEIEVKTGRFKEAGTHADVKLILYGTKDKSQEIVLNSHGKHHLHKDKLYKLTEKIVELGDITHLEIIKKDKLISPNWLLDFIVVRGGGKEFRFPYFGWLDGGTNFIREGRAYLSKDDPHKEVRGKELVYPMLAYQWAPAYKNLLCNNVRGKINELPINEQWNDDRTHDLRIDAKQALASAGWSLIKDLGKKWDSLDDFERIFQFHMKRPAVCINWRTDETFGNERLYGATLTQFERIDEIPAKFAVTDEDVKGLLRSGETLASELKNKRLYMVDYHLLDNIPEFLPGKYMASPMCLFYLNGNNKFVPIAIQLYQEPNPEWNPVYTPNDPPHDWLMAKLVLGNADFGYFQAISHYVRGHLLTEPLIISLNRNLPFTHPVYKLLKPHTKYHLGINVLGRTTLFHPGGMVIKIGPVTFDASIEIMSRFYKTWKYEDLDLRDWLKARKIPGPEELPNYYYRDDVHAMCDAIETFVRDVLKLYYKSDADVAADQELQNFAQEIETQGFNNSGKFPTKIETLDQLVKIIQIYISNGVLHHSVINFAQYGSFSMIPMAPAAIYVPPPGWGKTPVKKGVLTEKDLLQALPHKKPTVKQAAQMYVLSQYSEAAEFIGDYYEFYFVEKEVLELKAKFQKKIKEIGDRIQKRGWDHLHPKKCPSSVAN